MARLRVCGRAAGGGGLTVQGEREGCGGHVGVDVAAHAWCNGRAAASLGAASGAEAVELSEGVEAGEARGGGGRAAVCHLAKCAADDGRGRVVVEFAGGELGGGRIGRSVERDFARVNVLPARAGACSRRPLGCAGVRYAAVRGAARGAGAAEAGDTNCNLAEWVRRCAIWQTTRCDAGGDAPQAGAAQYDMMVATKMIIDGVFDDNTFEGVLTGGSGESRVP